ncbi:MAG: RNA methyltransferase [Breznakibacter sp.]
MMSPLPDGFVQRIQTQFPGAGHPFIQALDTDPSVSVRHNPAKPFGGFRTGEAVPWCPHGVYLPERPGFTLDPFFHAGCYYPQEASSMFIHFVMRQVLPGPNAQTRVLDLCAAPGGKSTLIASYLNGEGVLVANETIRSRAYILAENIIKWGLPNVIATQNDPSRFSVLENSFDVVLVDAPCSGEGMFRKDSVARTEWSEANAALCAVRQRRIVADVWPAVKEGGYLIYSTCTFNPNENEDNLDWLVTQFDAEVVALDNIPKEWGISCIDLGKGCGYAFYPHQVRGEGFFCAVVRKLSGNIESQRKRAGRQDKKGKEPKLAIPAGLLANPDEFVFATPHGKILALPPQMEDVYRIAETHLTVFHAGVALGETVKNDFSPDHSLAMSIYYSGVYPSIDLPVGKALDYLRGDTQLGQFGEKGWNVVGYSGVPLGFVKSMGNRLNNYYPKEWRIRMR